MSAYHTPSAETNPRQIGADAKEQRRHPAMTKGGTRIVATNPREKCDSGEPGEKLTREGKSNFQRADPIECS